MEIGFNLWGSKNMNFSEVDYISSK